MIKARRINAPGGLDRLKIVQLSDPGKPGVGEVRVRLHATSLNNHDYRVAAGETGGPEALSYDEVADRITAVAQRPVRHCRLSVEELARRYAGFGIPERYADALARMDDAISHGSEDRTTTEVEQVTGRKPTKLTDFLAAHSEA